jgi:Peptide-N-glycosidase F, C terminal/Secretion system C-terminal sorting domain
MKHLRLTFSFLMLFGLTSSAFASPGDTTIVSTSPVLNADGSASYDTLIVLPSATTYRKIYLVYTVNSHACAAGSTYCHQWDYIGNVTLKSPHGDTVELARIITPFATSGWSRFPSPPGWSEDYVFDVTDFAPLLKDSITINSALGVGSPGYGIYTKLIFIEGTPDRNTISIKRVYAHGGTYGSATNPIDNNFPVTSETAPAGTVSAAFRFIVTGHGSDANYCCEFAEHYYDLYLNGSSILRQNIWRTDCGFNELYPQGGTWLYNRSNWCPGSSVIPYYDALPGVTAGSSYNVNVVFEPYTVTSPSGNYDASASVVYYGGMNKTLDASIEDIIAPSSSPQHFRENPGNNLPIVHIHNSGSTAISSVSFQYGMVDSTMQTYTWSGALASLADTIISLPASISMTYLSANATSGTFPFIIAITGVNGTPDADQTNDTMRSQFIAAPRWPDTLAVRMLTSNLSADGSDINVNPADASWYITNVSGDTILSRTNTTYSTLYIDTLTLPANGFYKFTVSSPGFCSGLHWWAFDAGLTGYAPGYLLIKKMTGANIPMHGYTYTTTTIPSGLPNEGEHDDYGCGYSQYFYVSTVNTTAVPATAKATSSIIVFPNPADDAINIELDNIDTRGSSISVINILGQTVCTANSSTGHVTINSRSFVPGLYTVLFNTTSGSSNIGKVVISH